MSIFFLIFYFILLYFFFFLERFRPRKQPSRRGAAEPSPRVSPVETNPTTRMFFSYSDFIPPPPPVPCPNRSKPADFRNRFQNGFCVLYDFLLKKIYEYIPGHPSPAAGSSSSARQTHRTCSVRFFFHSSAVETGKRKSLRTIFFFFVFLCFSFISDLLLTALKKKKIISFSRKSPYFFFLPSSRPHELCLW